MSLLNRKVDYSLLILCYLHQKGVGASAREVADHFKISRPFVANILKDLCQQDYVSSYRGVKGGRRVIFMNATDMVERDLIEGQLVDLVSEWSDGERRVESFSVIAFDIPRGNCATYFPETNPLVPLDSVADRSRTPTSKSVIIRVIPSA